MEDIINKLIDSDNVKHETKDTLREYFNDDKILDIYKHKLIKCTITNTKKMSGGKSDYDLKIENYDSKLLSVLYEYYEKENLLTTDVNKVLKYIFDKYEFNTNTTTFYVNEHLSDSPDKENYYNVKIDYYNTFPKENIVCDKIFIKFRIHYKDFIKKINIIDIYVSYVISKYLKTNGCLIINIPLLFDNSDFLNFVKQLCRKFLYVKIIYAKRLMQISTGGFIILYNKSDDMLFIDNDFNKIVEKYIKKFRKYILKAFELTIRIIQLNTIDKMAYQTLYDKMKYKLQY